MGHWKIGIVRERLLESPGRNLVSCSKVGVIPLNTKKDIYIYESWNGFRNRMRELLEKQCWQLGKSTSWWKIIYMFAQGSLDYKQNFKVKLKESRLEDSAFKRLFKLTIRVKENSMSFSDTCKFLVWDAFVYHFSFP